MGDHVQAGRTRTSAPAGTGAAPGKRSPGAAVSSFLFYLALIVIVMTALAYSQGGAGGKEVLGYRIYTVLTSSMDSVIPQGSLVVVKQTDPRTLSVGQDITFYKDKDTVVTHRIEEIGEDQGHLVFTTKGVDNTQQDPEPVFDDNVVGKVVFHIPAVGTVSAAIISNIFWVAGAFAVLLLMSFALRLIFTKDEPDQGPNGSNLPPIPPPTFLGS